MGFTAPRRTYQLSLGDDFAGLDVTVRSVSIGEYLRLSGFTNEDRSVSYAIDQFMANLVAWNLETEDGQPIPIAEAREQDKELVLALTAAWVESLHGVAAPLEPSSQGGGPSLVESIPTEALSTGPMPS
jgi:hypothetical protein